MINSNFDPSLLEKFWDKEIQEQDITHLYLDRKPLLPSEFNTSLKIYPENQPFKFLPEILKIKQS